MPKTGIAKPSKGPSKGPSKPTKATPKEAAPESSGPSVREANDAVVDRLVASLLTPEWSHDKAVALAGKKLHGKYMSLDKTARERTRPVWHEGSDARRGSKRRLAPRAAAPPEVSAATALLVHRSWLVYARDERRALDDPTDAAALAQLVHRLERHGCRLRVTRSRCPSHVSLAGIVLQETRDTFVLQGDDERQRRVPKEGSTFSLSLPAVDSGTEQVTMQLSGEHLRWKNKS